MYISNVRIENYRGIKTDSFQAKPFVCIIGENNAGKSSILLGISLFFSGTTLSISEFYDQSKPISIQLTFSEISQGDIDRLQDDHRERLKGEIINNELTLERRFAIDGKSGEFLCKKLVPTDPTLNKDFLKTLLKGKTGKAIALALQGALPKYADKFESVKTQSEGFTKVDEISSTLPEAELKFSFEALATGISNSIKPLLPEIIYVAAVKNLKDELKVRESTTFGKLLGILSKFIEESEDIENVLSSLDTLHELLNRVEKLGVIEDNRHHLLQGMEDIILIQI